MMLTLLVAGLVIGCSSEPAAPAAPAAPVPSFSEREVIAIARSSNSAGSVCFDTKHQYYGMDDESDYTFSNYAHSESATFKPNGLWLVRAKTTYDIEAHHAVGTNKGTLGPGETNHLVYECNLLVDDATGKVSRN